MGNTAHSRFMVVFPSKYNNLENVDGSSRIGMTPSQKNKATRTGTNSAVQKSKVPVFEPSKARQQETNRASLPDIKLKQIDESHA